MRVPANLTLSMHPIRTHGRDLLSCYYYPCNPEIRQIGRIEGSTTLYNRVETVLGRRTRCPRYRTTLGTTSRPTSTSSIGTRDAYLGSGRPGYQGGSLPYSYRDRY
ncbi:hypothetical protein L249_5363 [Ophiocordyceps polyrhachis-furcata BCC 54312]|uniref:Uncharacterized protein n=1 Tax=Ophiocordyceps polyrhachis-furcata BCC 54312 TaxID=1330021 RepID=A0A367L8L7_9HYPO|nr:hypothetical protein L249_5363 [Ophiocordyceps polyrhachis-furcata BCC 54312]